jgi:hypothetical protein
MKKTVFSIIYATIFVFVFFNFNIITKVQITNAQTLPPGIEEQLSFKISPSTPGANETVFASIESFITNLDKSTISWYINGELTERGLGIKNISFKTGNTGEESSINVVIQKPDGTTLEKNYSITPAEVDISYEAINYTPPFYKGKTLFGFQSLVKFVAFPNFVDENGNQIDTNNIVYTWEINGTVDGQRSGTGKDVYVTEGGILGRPIEVNLTASPVNSNQKARVIRTFFPTPAELAVYEKNPIYGTLFEKRIVGDFNLNRTEIEFEVFPFYFDNNIFYDGNAFTWKVNGEESTSSTDPRFITLRRTDDNPGAAGISVEIRHNDKILQAARQYFNLIFEENIDNEFNF